MRKFLLVISAVALLASCTSDKNKYTINGTVPDDSYDGKYVYLTNFDKNERVDSALIANGKFTLSDTISQPGIYRLNVERSLSATLVVEGGQTVSVELINQRESKVTGTDLNDAFTRFNATSDSVNNIYRERFMSVQNDTSLDPEVRGERANAIFEEFNEKYDAILSDAYTENKDNALGAFILLNWSQMSTLDAHKFKSKYNEGGAAVKNSERLKKIIKSNEQKELTAEGKPFVDFTIENGNLDGTPAKLSDYVGKGKYVLVDFWGSWCGPCKAEIPNLVEVYKKHKGDKFELLGVAVWDKREDSEKAIEEHGMTWSHIIDAQSIPTDAYGIDGIPQIILFGPDGTIVARDLRGDNLKAKVAEVLQ